METTKLRLLLTVHCNRACPGCCNNDWDLSGLEICDPETEDWNQYDELLITGGEPLLYPEALIELSAKAKARSSKLRVYVYTAYTENLFVYEALLPYVDGFTFTLHEQADVQFAKDLSDMLMHKFKQTLNKSFRMNIFSSIQVDAETFERFYRCTPFWKIKADMKWIEDCPLPDGEVFKRLRSH